MSNEITAFETTPSGDGLIHAMVEKDSQDHEFIVWDDGTLTIEHWLYQYSLDPAQDHARLSPVQARNLRHLLNQGQTKTFLGIPAFEPTTKPVYELGRHTLEVRGQNITLSNKNGTVTLNSTETYRLYTVLHEMFKNQQ